jgi:hypothetical protein
MGGVGGMIPSFFAAGLQFLIAALLDLIGHDRAD